MGTGGRELWKKEGIMGKKGISAWTAEKLGKVWHMVYWNLMWCGLHFYNTGRFKCGESTSGPSLIGLIGPISVFALWYDVEYKIGSYLECEHVLIISTDPESLWVWKVWVGLCWCVLHAWDKQVGRKWCGLSQHLSIPVVPWSNGSNLFHWGSVEVIIYTPNSTYFVPEQTYRPS